MKPRILIISYHFDPSTWIGARRWTKFAKSFKNFGAHVHVITTNDPELQGVAPTLDVPRTVVERKYPEILSRTSLGLLDKLRYRWALSRMKRNLKGSFYDRTGEMEIELSRAIDRAIEEHKIDTIIASGAPFSLLYYAAKVKSKNPNIKLVTDLRDPWTWGTIYGMDNLDKSRMDIEESRERFVVENSDIFSVPVQSMQEHLQSKYPEQSSKIQLLPHAYDPDEISVVKRQNRLAKKWIYYGTINKNLEKHMAVICEFMAKNPEVSWDIFTAKPEYVDIIRQYDVEKQIRFHHPVPSSALFSSLADYDVFMCPWPDYAKNFITTKFIELFVNQIPVFHVGVPGNLSSFIDENGLGRSCEVGDFERAFGECLQNPEGFTDYNFDFDTSPWSYPGEAKQLLDWISNVGK